MSRTRSVAFIGVALTLLGVPCMAESLFNGAVFDLGGPSQFVTVADVNADGNQDTITSGDFGVRQISVLLGDGQGGFAPQIPTTVAFDPYQIATGEFNGDGQLDLVVTNAEFSGPQVLLGNGDGTFLVGQHLILNEIFVSVAVADFDGDSRLDVALGRPFFNLDILVYFGAGDGTFSLGRRISPGRIPTTLATADLNADGVADLVVGEGSPSALAVHLGVGNGTFQTGGRWEIGQGFGTIALGDLNGDGIKDAVVADDLSSDVSAFLGLGDGTFLPSGRFPVGTSPRSLAIVQFNADQRADIVTVNSTLFSVHGSDDLSILAGNGDGTFGAEVRFRVPAPRYIASADLDGDRDHDLAIATLPGMIISFNNASGRLRRDVFQPMTSDPGQFATGDLNNDGNLDLMVCTAFLFPVAGKVNVMLGRGDGTFKEAANLGVDFPVSVHVVDLDHDDKEDAVVQAANSDVEIFIGGGDGSFAFGSRIASSVDGALATGDLNDDGNVDLVATRSFPARLDVRLGNGDGTFGAPQSFSVEPPDLAPFVITISDLDEDGRLDATVGSNPTHGSDRGAVSVLLGMGDGTFGPSRSLGQIHPVRDLAVIDFDADGKRDIAVLTIRLQGFFPQFLEGLTLFMGQGNGEFHPPEHVFGEQLIAIDAGDIDGDGDEDLVATRQVGFFPEFMVLLGGQQSELDPPRFLASLVLNRSLPHIIAIDTNRDERLDVVYSGAGGVTIALNEGPFPNEPPVAVAAAEPRVECTSSAGAEVTLDGSGSSDPDSAPGTLDDIVAFDWFEDMGLASERLVGTGQILLVTLPLGDHAIALRVTDSAGETAVDEVTVSVVDATPPVVEAGVSPHLLWPPNHRMVPVEATVTAVDVCGQATTALESVTSDEEDDAAGPEDGKTRGDILGAQVATADTALELRAERDGGGDGRVYTLTYIGTDESGNPARAAVMVVVPHDQSGVTDPVEVTAREGPAGTVLEWGAVAGAFYYNVVRGHVGRVRPEADAIGLGDLACIESRSLDATSAGHEDAQRPPPGEAYFYLVEYNDGWGSSFGSEGVGLPRVKQGGGCPP